MPTEEPHLKTVNIGQGRAILVIAYPMEEIWRVPLMLGIYFYFSVPEGVEDFYRVSFP